MNVIVNGETMDVDENTSVATLLQTHGFPVKGIAVAVDATVLPRARWDSPLTEGAKVEVVTAVQGG